MSKSLNVLLTAGGGLTGTFLIKHYRKTNKSLNIVATDCNELVPAKTMADRFYKSPLSSNKEEYIDFLSDLVKKEKIDIIIPITSTEVEFFSSNNFLSNSIKVAITNKEDNEKLTNKQSMNSALSSIGLNVPKVYNEKLEFPFFIKPLIGSGSKGSRIINDSSEIKEIDLSKFLCTEIIKASEFTVDCLFDGKGKCIGYNNRQRLKVVGGGATVCESLREPLLNDIIDKISKNFSLYGPINFQYFKKDDKIIIIDFNTRFASGGLPLAVNVGFDIPNMLIKMLTCETDIEIYSQSSLTDGRKMIRYYEELFI